MDWMACSSPVNRGPGYGIVRCDRPSIRFWLIRFVRQASRIVGRCDIHDVDRTAPRSDVTELTRAEVEVAAVMTS